METVACNLCNETKENTVFRDLPDLFLGRFDVRSTLVQCARCQLIYQNPRPTIKEISGSYPDSYEWYGPIAEQRSTSFLRQKAFDYGFARRARTVLNHKTWGSLLDLGCSIGLFLNEIARHPRWDVHGVEISPTASEIARSRYQLDVFTGTLEDARFSSNSYDAVTLWDVLEHLHDPFATLTEIHRIMKDDGILVIRVPNATSWEARIFGPAWSGLDLPRHLYVFNQVTLTSMLHKAGFKVIESNASSGSYTNFLISLRFWIGLHSSKGLPNKNLLLKVLAHPAIRLLTVPIFFIPGIFRRGPLLTIVAEKAE
ncbi:MAG: class I SAM-dependent methyltransferase [Anaerolineaceae bacterium]|nr:class I SAM-dependent methyltransferase [Anaerolineaceae bacterium]